MNRNSATQWGSVSKTLHWLVLALIVIEVPAGFLMSHTYGLSMRDAKEGLPLHTLAGQIHHTSGFIVLVLIAVRLSWRAIGGVTPGSFAPRIVHGALYLLLIALPLSGWAALSVFGEAPLWLFNCRDIVPPLLHKVPLSAPHGYGFYARLHVRLLWIGLTVLALHIAAALWHHFVRRDDVLRRMWPLAALKSDPAP